MSKYIDAKVTVWCRYNLDDKADLSVIENKIKEGYSVLEAIDEQNSLFDSEYLFDTEEPVQNILGENIYEIYENDKLVNGSDVI
mgnify:FL=1|jgi:hypothetical protein